MSPEERAHDVLTVHRGWMASPGCNYGKVGEALERLIATAIRAAVEEATGSTPPPEAPAPGGLPPGVHVVPRPNRTDIPIHDPVPGVPDPPLEELR